MLTPDAMDTLAAELTDAQAQGRPIMPRLQPGSRLATYRSTDPLLGDRVLYNLATRGPVC